MSDFDLAAALADSIRRDRAELSALARCRRLMKRPEPIKVSDLAEWLMARHDLSGVASLQIARRAARHACERSRYRP